MYTPVACCNSPGDLDKTFTVFFPSFKNTLLWYNILLIKIAHYVYSSLIYSMGFPEGSAGKESACNAGNVGLLTGVRKIPWRRKWLPTSVFLPGEFRGAWQGTVHGVVKSQTGLSN